MKKICLYLAMLIATAGITNAGWWSEEGSGNITKEERKISDASGIVLKTVGNVYLKQGSAPYFRIDTDENIHKYIKIKFDGDNLVIYTDKAVKPTKLNIFITLTDCNDIILDGSGNIEFVGKLNTTYCNIDINGSGDIEMENVKSNKTNVSLDGSGDIYFSKLYTDKVRISLAGSGDIRFVGKANSCDVKIIGSGDVDLDDFVIDYFSAEILGSGDISVYVNKSLKAKVFGSGDILYLGEPEEIKLESFGSGTIRKK